MGSHERKAAKNYKTFHGKPVKKVTKIKFTMPKSLTFLADARAIEYHAPGKVKGNRKPFRHTFGKNVKIYLHPDRRWILITGGRFNVTDWMRY